MAAPHDCARPPPRTVGLERIVLARPDESWLARVLAGAKRALRERTWEPLTLDEIDQLAESRRVRVVRCEEAKVGKGDLRLPRNRTRSAAERAWCGRQPRFRAPSRDEGEVQFERMALADQTK
jgi:hypothetical protein